MECKADGCTHALTGRQREFCSDKCRKRASRTQATHEDGSRATNADKTAVEPGQTERGQQSRTRPPIPGDPDYFGVCKLIDGEWMVDNTKPNVQDMSDDELIRRLHFIKDWKRSPEHKEVLRRKQVVQEACL